MKSKFFVVAILVFTIFIFSGCVKKQNNLNIMSLENNLKQKVVLVVAYQGFQDLEYKNTKEALEKEGIEVTVTSSLVGIAKGKLGERIKIEKDLSSINLSEFDALVFIGGPGALEYLNDSQAHRLIKEAIEQEKILGAICIAPEILAQADVLKDKKATVWSSSVDNSPILFLEEKGAEYVDEQVVKDGKIITAKGPEAATKFGEEIAEALK